MGHQPRLDAIGERTKISRKKQCHQKLKISKNVEQSQRTISIHVDRKSNLINIFTKKPVEQINYKASSLK